MADQTGNSQLHAQWSAEQHSTMLAAQNGCRVNKQRTAIDTTIIMCHVFNTHIKYAGV